MDEIYEDIAALRAKMLHCECPCGCTYVLYSTRSKETSLCLSCRTQLHFGSTPLLEEEPTP